MLEGWLGEAGFRAGVRLHMRRFEHGVADVDDFLQSMADGSGEPRLLEVFRSFLFQPGVPLLQVALDCAGEQPALELLQSRYLPLGSDGQRDQVWQLPVCVRYSVSDGAAARHCALITTTPARLPLPTSACPAWVMPNADGFGYYRIAFDPAGWEQMFAHFDVLSGNEARVLLASLSAAFRSGDLPVETLFAAMARLASHPDREVATAPLRDLFYVRQWLARTPAARAALEARVREFYGPRQRELGLAARTDDTTDDALLRAALVDAVAILGRDRELRERLTRAAEVYLGSPAAAPDGIDPGILATMLRVAVEDAGPDFATGLLETFLLADDATFRGRALTALGSASDPGLGAALRDLLGDPRLRDNEASGLAFLQAGNEHQRDAIWGWIQDDGNRDRLLARIPSWRKGGIVRIGAGGCDAAHADAVAAWFAPLADELEGGPRALAQTVENIRLCAALVAAQADAVTAYLQR
jgi:alanyl aminopeptidase